MSNIHKFTENIKSTYGKASAALSSGITSATFVDMKNYDLMVATIAVTNIASGKTVTLRLWEATAAAGTNSASLAITDTFTAQATSDTDVLIAQVRAAQLSTGYQYVGWKVASDDTTSTAVVGGVTLQLNPRYAQETLV